VRVDLSPFNDVIFGLVPKIHDHRISQTFTRRPASSGAFGVHGSRHSALRAAAGDDVQRNVWTP